MNRKSLAVTALSLAAFLPLQMRASEFTFSFAGPGVSGTVNLTYGTATDAKYSQAFEITGVSGTFTDTNNGLNIVDVPIGALVPIKHDSPEPTNLLAPDDFSRFAVATGLPSEGGGFLTYTNLFYPTGSPQTATDYPFHGGFLDIYGLMFEIGEGRVVDVWSNGDFTGSGSGPIDWGVGVATSETALDYVGGGVSASPEPSALALLGSGLAALVLWKRRSTRKHASAE